MRRVRSLKTNAIFACKIVKACDEEMICNSVQEFKNWQRLEHKNIVKVEELYVDELCNKIYTIMEYIN